MTNEVTKRDLEQATFTEEQKRKIEQAEAIIGYTFTWKRYLLSAITHPSATEGLPANFSYERLEFLGDSLLGALVALSAFDTFHDLDEGGLTRIKVALVSGSSLSQVAYDLGFADIIVFGSSEAGTGRRGLHSALENVYEAVVAALYLDGGFDAARGFVMRTLIPRMSEDMAQAPENPKSALQEKLQEDGITPTYKLVDTQGPPHNRTFVAQVFAGSQGLAQGSGRTKKEAESQAAKSTLARLSEFFESIGKKNTEEDSCRVPRKGRNRTVVNGGTEVETRVDGQVDERVEARVDERVDERVEAQVDERVDEHADEHAEARVDERVEGLANGHEPHSLHSSDVKQGSSKEGVN